jgi:hypothetical protein
MQTRSQLPLDQMDFKIHKDHSEGANAQHLEAWKCKRHDYGKELLGDERSDDQCPVFPKRHGKAGSIGVSR